MKIKDVGIFVREWMLNLAIATAAIVLGIAVAEIVMFLVT